MDWFKHYTSSHEDPDISDAWDEFGDSAVVVFWTVLEIYGREFSHLKDGYLTISIRYFERKLRRKWKKVEKILAFFALRHRILFEKTDLTVSISIPKFIAVASNWTKRHPVSPTEVPTEASTEAPTAKEEDKEYKEEKDKRLNTTPKSSSTIPPCPHQTIVSLYHEMLPELPKVTDWTTERQALLRARWVDKAERQNIEWWKGYFESVRKSAFLMGQTDPAPGRKLFRADLEWLVRKQNMVKVLEGKYTDTSVGGLAKYGL